MSQVIEVKMPGIGDAAAMPVIEILVKIGDVVAVDDPLCTLESDKATMDVPSSAAGVVKEIRVKVGEKVGEGAVLLTLESNGSAIQPTPTTAAAATASGTELQCDVLVLGGGPGGYSAAFRSADLGRKTIIVERYASLGGVCLNVGCIPSKALLHIASVMEEVPHLASLGIDFGAQKVDIDKLRAHKDSVVNKLTGGLAGMAKGRKVEVVRGVGRFLDPQRIEVALCSGSGQEQTGEKQVIRFKQCVIAAGSQAVKLPFMPQDPRIVDSTGALELRSVPKRMLVVGGGIIGLEMATVYSALGARIDVVEMLDGLMQGPDRDLVKVWEKHNSHRFDHLMLNTRTLKAEASEQGIWVTFEGEKAPAEPQCYDLVLVAVGRKPNGNQLDADKAGVNINERGFIPVDKQLRTNVPHIFAIGDIVGQPMLAHKAVHEGHVAAEVAAGEALNNAELARSRFDTLQIPGVAYTNPEVAWAGLTQQEAKDQGIKVETAVFPWAASGRAIANGRDEGFTKLLFDAHTHRVVGGGIVGTGAGDLISEVCLAIEMGANAEDIGKTIHPHPTLGETVGMAAEVAHGSCTDLPAARRKEA
ncbi:dihydrolipoamide dehydrogenase [Pseudomonas fluorescens NCIMB 11764]|uniref:Dihydrolipoyl dehydrogenase n=1 Tax=Pseudomonas fluorescens NCIMB 11764 TaxID=1221522 RepID=A0A0K1QQG1_PSEFL|nr:dihydrolipoyl dehydrogenase [Pseudomonas fluorescens]AKV07953.1 dihydrolipoamide dehydrogenase [Pseudomonas fluorescens NCIMB 11764]